MSPERALLSDTNKYTIEFYSEIQRGKITPGIVRDYLEKNGKILSNRGDDFYYEMRDRFNEFGDPLDLLFINRSCFNGVMRFNSKGKFNVPFGHKINRFAKSYITKIVNQVKCTSDLLCGGNWEFKSQDWRESLKKASVDDFVYLDPPYIGRNTDYYNNWTDENAVELSNIAQNLDCGFALSMWSSNIYRTNAHIPECWAGNVVKTFSHFYHVGSTESLRNEMEEALVIKNGFAVLNPDVKTNTKANVKSTQIKISEY
jgi:DNA adenine methylase